MIDPRPGSALSEVQDLVAGWRRAGLTVGWTNGCFDVIHAGHVQMLGFARRNCDRLIVGVNSDLSVRRLKGEGRPHHTLSDRLTVLAALRPVDALLVMAFDTPIHEIGVLRPDIVVKDDSYHFLAMPERSVVEEQGGTIMLFPRVEGLSTTHILRNRGPSS
jgi:D-beta-D-heptose 7-phosphate kinase/D-beta-D-heptose 1-phosphate adenosyltransferase